MLHYLRSLASAGLPLALLHLGCLVKPFTTTARYSRTGLTTLAALLLVILETAWMPWPAMLSLQQTESPELLKD